MVPVHWGFMGLSIGSTGPPRVGMGHVFMKILGLQVYNYPFDGFSFSATVEPELTYQWSNKNQGSVFQQQPQGVSRCFTDMDISDTGYFNVGGFHRKLGEHQSKRNSECP